MRSANMVVLGEEVRAKHPGMVIYGIGNLAHQAHPSAHNEDDTPGSKAEDQDADSKPEHRGLDFMLGALFSRSDAYALVNQLLAPRNRKRLLYVIWDKHIWSRNSGWEKRDYNGDDPHTNHVHVSGEADDDENTASWLEDEDMPTVDEVWSKTYAEYVDENGNEVRDRRTVADILYATHRNTVLALDRITELEERVTALEGK